MTTPPSVLRGDIVTTMRMEMLQVGYLHAVAAAAGCALSSPWPDAVGTDWNVDHPHSAHVRDPISTVRVQLKSTHQVTPAEIVGKSEFSFTLENPHLAKLNMPKPTITRLLVVMLTPSDADYWLLSSPDELAVRHRCYWVNLAGKAITGQDKTNVRVPTKNVFDDIALCQIMEMVGRGVVPR